MGDDRPRQGRCWPLAAALAAGALAAAAAELGEVAGRVSALATPLIALSLAALWALAASGSPAARLAGLLWGLAAVLLSHRWLLWLHPLGWIGVPAPLSLPLCLALWGFCALAGGALVQLWLVLVRRAGPLRASTALAASCLWGLAEVLLARGPLFWIGLAGASLPGDRPLAGLAAYGGAGLVTAAQLLLGWCLWRLLAAGARRRRWLLLTLALVLLSHGLGLQALSRAAPGAAAGAAAGAPAGPQTEPLLLLQPAIPTREKGQFQQQRRLLSQLLAAGLAAASPGPEQAVSLLLPEGSLPAGQELPQPAPVELLRGGVRREGEGQRSSVLRFAPGGLESVGWVDKRRVVPLGEWVPGGSWLRWSGLSAVGGVDPGAPERLLSRPGGAIGVAICYEIADGAALVQASRQGAVWLLASANLDPYPALLRRQFLALARLRAIESGRWLVSVANTGPSAVVDDTGRVRQELPGTGAGTFRVRVEHREGLTGYGRWGEAPLGVGLMLALLLRARGRGG